MYEEVTYESILERMLEKVPDNMDKREGSIIYDALAPAAVELQLMYIELDVILKETFADTASRDYLLRRAEERGITPKAATKAILKGVFTPLDIELSEGERFSCDSLNYRVLEKIKAGGMRSLIASNKLDLGGIRAYHIGFVLGPCLNASGRLDTAKKALLLLKTKDEVDAGKLAEELIELNTNRKSLTEKGIEDAMQCIETQGLSEDRVLVIYLPDCHESIAGIIAGRVRERYHRPVYVLTNAKEGVKGSGRSIEGYSMYEELCKCQDLLDKFGGHPMAAGCSMQRKNVDTFRKRLNDCCTLTQKDLQPKIRIDVPMTLEYLSEELIHEFAVLEPFGKGNEKPVFADKELRVRDIRIVGTNRKFVRMKLVDKTNRSYQAICFDGDAYENQKYLEEHKENLSIVYYPQINTFFGEAQIEVLITHFR